MPRRAIASATEEASAHECVMTSFRHLRDHCLAPERVDAPVAEGGRYGRMFELPPLEADETLLHRIGAAGGFCDAGHCAEDANVEAGWPFFGQYVAHDLTADRRRSARTATSQP
jgi:hypothetical protein